MLFESSNRVNRSIFIAIAGLALVGAQSPSSLSNTEEHPYRPYSERLSESCYNARNHDAADLCAQWRAAIAAEKTAKEARVATIVSIIGIALSFATVVGLIVTIWQTHGALGEARRGNRLNLAFERRSRREARKAAEDQERALEIAERNAEAAASHVRVAEDTANKQLRAYLDIFDLERNIVRREDWDQDDSSFFRLSVCVKNFGQTPARNVRSAFEYQVRRVPLKGDFPTLSPESIYDIPPNGSHLEILSSGIKDAALAQIVKGNAGIYVFAHITYDDIFGDSHHLKFILVSRGLVFGDGLFAVYSNSYNST